MNIQSLLALAEVLRNARKGAGGFLSEEGVFAMVRRSIVGPKGYLP